MAFRIFVGRLPQWANESDLKEFFSEVGQVLDPSVKKGYGFVNMESEELAVEAVDKLNGRKLRGERIVVQHANNSSLGKKQEQRPTARGFGLIVENLSSRADSRDLGRFMEEAGDIIFAEAHNRRRNQGFVKFASYSGLARAVDRFDGEKLEGQRIRLIDVSKRRRYRSRSGSRSGSRGGRGRDIRSRSGSRSSSRTFERRRGGRRQRSLSGSRSPAKRSRSRSPVNRSRSRSPAKRNRNRSPVNRNRNRSPAKRNRSRSPVNRNRNKSPAKRSRSKSPVKRSPSRSDSGRDGRSAPRDECKNTSRSVSPREARRSEYGERSLDARRSPNDSREDETNVEDRDVPTREDEPSPSDENSRAVKEEGQEEGEEDCTRSRSRSRSREQQSPVDRRARRESLSPFIPPRSSYREESGAGEGTPDRPRKRARSPEERAPSPKRSRRPMAAGRANQIGRMHASFDSD